MTSRKSSLPAKPPPKGSKSQRLCCLLPCRNSGLAIEASIETRTFQIDTLPDDILCPTHPAGQPPHAPSAPEPRKAVRALDSIPPGHNASDPIPTQPRGTRPSLPRPSCRPGKPPCEPSPSPTAHPPSAIHLIYTCASVSEQTCCAGRRLLLAGHQSLIAPCSSTAPSTGAP